MTVNINILVIEDSYNIATIYDLCKKVQVPCIRQYTLENFLPMMKKDFNFEKTMLFSSTKKCIVEVEDIPDIAVTWNDEDPSQFEDFMRMVLDRGDIKSHPDYEVFRDVQIRQEPPEAGYVLGMFYDKPRDWMFYQITRPFDDQPFTTIVKEYSKVGMEPMFAYFYACNAWGILSQDQEFLIAVWNEFKIKENLQGDLDLETLKGLVKKYGDLCIPTEGHIPHEEPQVFRVGIEHLERFIVKKEEEEEEEEEVNKRPRR